MDKSNITSNLVVSIKNGYSNKNKFVYCKTNKFITNILWILYKEGLISDFKIDEKTALIKIRLKYIKTKPLLTEIKLISKPQLQRYTNYNGLKPYYKKFDYFFLSTSNGIISSKTFLKNKYSGGKLLFGLKLNS